MTYLILLSAMFSSTMLVPGYSLGDMIGTLIIIKAIYKYRFSFRFLSPKNHINIFLFLIWVLINGFIIYFIGFLDVSEFMKSLIKLLFYVTVYYSTYTLLREIKLLRIYNQVSIVIFINALIAIYIFIAMHIDLPYDFFWAGHQAPETSAYYAGSLFVRARGIFTEPAILGYFLVLGQAFLLINNYKINRLKNLTTWVAIILTFSVTTYFLAGLVILIVYKDNIKKIAKLGLIIVFSFSLISLLPDIRESMQIAVVDRIIIVFSSNNQGSSSANTRLNKTWDIAFDNLQESYFLGSGLGNHDLSYARVNNLNIQNTVIETHNILSYILGTTGIIGLIIFLSLFGVFRNNKSLGLVFFASLFVNGYFLSPLFWVFYCLYSLDEINFIKEDTQCLNITG